MILVGTGRRIINPEKGHLLCGYGTFLNTGVHDDISVTALFLNDGTSKTVFLNYDLVGLAARTIERIQNAVAAATKIDPKNVFLACTHVHSAPHPLEAEKDEDTSPYCRPDYMVRLLNWSVEAAQDAVASPEECQLRYNFTHVDENINRRFNFPDRRFLYIPDNKQLLGLSKGYLDQELGIIAFRKKDTKNEYKAVITNYTCHPLCVGNSSNLVTADFQGVLRHHVEETFAGCMCLSTTGAAGNNHPKLPEGGFACAEAMGSHLAQQTIARCYDSIAAGDEKLRLAYTEITLPYRDEETFNMLPNRQTFATLPEAKEKGCKTHLSLLGIGPILLSGFPGEPMAEHGAMLKWSSPFLKSYVLFTATGCLGYFPTTNQLHWGGYESSANAFIRGAGEMMVQHVISKASELLRAHPLNLPILDDKMVNGRAD